MSCGPDNIDTAEYEPERRLMHRARASISHHAISPGRDLRRVWLHVLGGDLTAVHIGYTNV